MNRSVWVAGSSAVSDNCDKLPFEIARTAHVCTSPSTSTGIDQRVCGGVGSLVCVSTKYPHRPPLTLSLHQCLCQTECWPPLLVVCARHRSSLLVEILSNSLRSYPHRPLQSHLSSGTAHTTPTFEASVERRACGYGPEMNNGCAHGTKTARSAGRREGIDAISRHSTVMDIPRVEWRTSMGATWKSGYSSLCSVPMCRRSANTGRCRQCHGGLVPGRETHTRVRRDTSEVNQVKSEERESTHHKMIV